MTRKRSAVPARHEQQEPPRVVRIWSELDGRETLETAARRAAANQPLFVKVEQEN